MAEQNKNRLHIRLHVYDEDIEVVINREDEEFYRLAAKLITERYNALFVHRTRVKSLLITLLDVVLS